MTENTNGWSDVFGYDEEVAKDGVWFEYPGNLGSFKLAMAGNKSNSYQQRLNALMKPHRRKQQMGLLDSETENQVHTEAFVDTVLIDWKNVHDEGKKLNFSKKNAMDLLLKYPKLLIRLIEDSSQEANFRKEQEEIEAKNSQKS